MNENNIKEEESTTKTCWYFESLCNWNVIDHRVIHFRTSTVTLNCDKIEVIKRKSYSKDNECVRSEVVVLVQI